LRWDGAEVGHGHTDKVTNSTTLTSSTPMRRSQEASSLTIVSGWPFTNLYNSVDVPCRHVANTSRRRCANQAVFEGQLQNEGSGQGLPRRPRIGLAIFRATASPEERARTCTTVAEGEGICAEPWRQTVGDAKKIKAAKATRRKRRSAVIVHVRSLAAWFAQGPVS